MEQDALATTSVQRPTGGAAAAAWPLPDDAARRRSARAARGGRRRAACTTNELLPGLELGAEAAPGDLSPAATPTGAPSGVSRLWQRRGADGQPSGLLKGALTFPGKAERHFHFTAFRHQSEAARVNSAYTDAELAGAAAREQRRLVRMAARLQRVLALGAARCVEEDAAMQAALAAQGAGGEGGERARR